jgi:hypothetical protein
LYEVWGFSIQWPLAHAAVPLAEMQANYMKTGAPATFGYQAMLGTVGGVQQLVMLGMFHGSRDDGLQVLDSLRKTPGAVLIEHAGIYAQLNEGLLDILTQPIDGLLELKRSGYIAAPLGLDGWNRVVQIFATTPNKYNLLGIEPYGGTLNSYPLGDSAFIHRDVFMDLFVDSFFDVAGKITTEQAARGWLTQLMSAVAPYRNGHVYQNYPERDLQDYRFAYWGDALTTLQQVKKVYDPDSFFLYGQSVAWRPEDQGVDRVESAGRFPDMEIEYEKYSQALRLSAL